MRNISLLVPVVQYRGLGGWRSYAEPGFLQDCTCEIDLDTDRINSGYGNITGTVKLLPTDTVQIKSIWVELEGNSVTQFQSKVDGKISSHLKRSQFLPTETADENNPRVFLIGNSTTTAAPKNGSIFEPGEYEYPFNLQLNYPLLPSSTKTNFGWIYYTVTVYVISLFPLEHQQVWSKKAAARETIRCKGFAALNPSLLSPLEVTLKKERFFFTKRTCSKVTLTLEQKGYVGGEEIKGVITVDNVSEDVIEEIEISLRQRFVYYYGYVTKCTVASVKEQILSIDSNEREIIASVSLALPRHSMPSFTDGKKSIEITYFIQVEMKRKGKDTLKGKTDIIVGTRWNVDGNDGVCESVIDQRRLSVVSSATSSNFDSVSLQSSSSLPPSYSSLANRRHSLEASPPLYDDIVPDYSSSTAVTPTGDISPTLVTTIRNSKTGGNGILWNCDCEIQLLTTEIIGGYDRIRGRIVIRTTDNVCFKNIWVQLEGHSISNFQTHGSDSRVTAHGKNYRFLPDQEESFPNHATPCCFILSRGGNESTTLQRGSYTYPFEIKLNGQTRPAPFRGPYGKTFYKIALHVVSLIGNLFWSEKIADEKIIKTAGYLRLYPNHSEPLRFVFNKERSFFAKRPPLKLLVTSEKGGYLPGEKIFCQIEIQNFSLEKISQISLAFVQKLTYYDNTLASKVMLAALDEQTHACETTDGLIRWDLTIPLPSKLMPSHGGEKKCIEVNYFLQIRVQGKSQVNGEGEIIIGTTRSMEDPEHSDVVNFRRVSVDSLWDTLSIQSNSTLPPPYSELSSRRASVETLPPVYDSVAADTEWINEQMLKILKN